MKLIFAIVHNEDAHKLTDELNESGYSVTRMCSTGGFLKSGNTTLIVGVEGSMVDKVIEIIKKNSKSRSQLVSSPIIPNGMGDSFTPFPMEITIGGATIFVIDVEKYEKI